MQNSFSSLGLSQGMLSNLESLSYNEMTPIQEKSLPLILESHDLIAQAKTGSGKTAAFGIGLLHKLDFSKRKLQAVVICPTRELSEQVATELRRLSRFQNNTKILTLVGGEALYPQKVALEKGVHIVVGTPGRIMDIITKGHLVLDNVKTLVLDEADRMLDMGFRDDIEAIIKYIPSARQTLLFSATFEEETKNLSRKFQSMAKFVKIEDENDEINIIQKFYKVENSDKVELIEKLIKADEISSALVFCNTKLSCDEVALELQERGFDAAALHGDMDQKDRVEVLTMFTNQSLNILVATDVAARGLDIEDLPAIFNYDISRQSEIHIHRIGRTGRMGKKGLAISFVGNKEIKFFKEIEEVMQTRYDFEDLKNIKKNRNFDTSAKMKTMKILAGKKDKIRAGDFVGAFSGELGFKGDDIGKILVLDRLSYVAVKKELFYDINLQDEKIRIKKKKYKYFKRL